jgi:hypothetical protein
MPGQTYQYRWSRFLFLWAHRRRDELGRTYFAQLHLRLNLARIQVANCTASFLYSKPTLGCKVWVAYI